MSTDHVVDVANLGRSCEGEHVAGDFFAALSTGDAGSTSAMAVTTIYDFASLLWGLQTRGAGFSEFRRRLDLLFDFTDI